MRTLLLHDRHASLLARFTTGSMIGEIVGIEAVENRSDPSLVCYAATQFVKLALAEIAAVRCVLCITRIV
jgi:hypothetical protein